jgi:hypothetical protein
MRTYSNEKILRAVGRLLDEAEAAGFAVRDTREGLVIEIRGRAFGREGDESFQLGLRDLAELVEWSTSEQSKKSPRYERSYAHDEGTLRSVLHSHELVSAGS